MAEVIGRMGTFGLWIFGRPYRVGILGWYSMRVSQDLSSLETRSL